MSNNTMSNNTMSNNTMSNNTMSADAGAPKLTIERETPSAAAEAAARAALLNLCSGAASVAALDDEQAEAMRAALDQLADARSTPPEQPDPFGGQWAPMPAEWLTQPPPPREWLLQTRDDVGFYPAHRVGVLAATGGVGKSWALTQLAVSLATGLPWLGTYYPAQPGRVLLVLAEEERNEVQRRIHYAASLMRSGNGSQPPPGWHNNIVPLALAGKNVQLLDDDDHSDAPFMRAMSERLDSDGEPWAAILLDPFARFAPSEAETDNAIGTRAVQACERLTHANGRPAVIIAHHTSKESARNDKSDQGVARGSTAIVDGARWMGVMRRAQKKGRTIPNYVRFNAPKSNYAPDARELLLIHDRAFDGALRLPSVRELADFDAMGSEPPASTPTGSGLSFPDEDDD